MLNGGVVAPTTPLRQVGHEPSRALDVRSEPTACGLSVGDAPRGVLCPRRCRAVRRSPRARAHRPSRRLHITAGRDRSRRRSKIPSPTPATSWPPRDDRSSSGAVTDLTGTSRDGSDSSTCDSDPGGSPCSRPSSGLPISAAPRRDHERHRLARARRSVAPWLPSPPVEFSGSLTAPHRSGRLRPACPGTTTPETARLHADTDLDGVVATLHQVAVLGRRRSCAARRSRRLPRRDLAEGVAAWRPDEDADLGVPIGCRSLAPRPWTLVRRYLGTGHGHRLVGGRSPVRCTDTFCSSEWAAEVRNDVRQTPRTR